MSLWALVPAKDFSRAKSRLSSVLDEAARAELAESMLVGVIDALLGSGQLQGLVVATDGPDVAHLARRRGAQVAFDPPGPAPGLGRIVDRALPRLETFGARRALVVMGDLPDICPADVHRLAAETDGAGLVLAPDTARRGTNALGMRLGTLPRTELGRPDSFLRHLAVARRRGLQARIVETPGLGRDVDTPADLRPPAAAPVHPAPRRIAR